jgi:hypothetical protein
VSVSTLPISQTVVASSTQFEFARYIFDASASGENIRVTSIPLDYTSNSPADLMNCKLYDSSTALTTGSNIKNPTAAGANTFTFDGTGLIVPKGTAKTVSLRCDIVSNATSSYQWGLDGTADTAFTGASGVTSGQTIEEVFTDANGQVMTASTTSGSLSATLDTSSPVYKIVSDGSVGVELARIRFTATDEDIDLKQVALQLSGSESNTPIDLMNREVQLFDTNGTQVATAVFAVGDTATSSQIAAGAFRIPANGFKVLVVKGNIANISVSGPLTASGDLLKIDLDGDAIGGTYGTGVSSGMNRNMSGNDTNSSGVRIMAAYPTLERVALSSSERLLQNGAEQTLYKFMVTAVGGDVALAKLTFNVSSSTGEATTSDYTLYAYTDSGYTSVDTTFSSDGKVNQSWNGEEGIVEIYPVKSFMSATTTYAVPDGATRYFELRAAVGNVSTTSSEMISVSLLGDAAYPTIVSTGTPMGTVSMLDADVNNDFIWSPISTTTSNSINDLDFTNGYQVSGLLDPNMIAETLTSTTEN